jgi:SAM-dependent methyltransferase
MPMTLSQEHSFLVRDNNVEADNIVPRIMRFYQAHKAVPEAELARLWTTVRDQFQAPLQLALESSSEPDIRRILASLFTGVALWGMDDPNENGLYPVAWTQAAIAAGVSLGVIPVFNPEQPSAEVCSAEMIITALEDYLGCRIDHPGASNSAGAAVGGRFIPVRLMRACTVAVSLRRILPFIPQTVLEIGAGTAMLPLLMPSAKSYQIVDLPLVTAMQAYLLAHALGSDRIAFSGEDLNQRAQVLLRGIIQPGDVEPESVDLVVNQDSMPEMPEAAIEKYIAIIGSVLRPGGIFYSVNHESSAGDQHRVYAQMKQHSKLALVHRSPFWARAGYVEELWLKAP